MNGIIQRYNCVIKRKGNPDIWEAKTVCKERLVPGSNCFGMSVSQLGPSGIILGP